MKMKIRGQHFAFRRLDGSAVAMDTALPNDSAIVLGFFKSDGVKRFKEVY